MGLYVLLSTLTPHGRGSLHSHPERIDAVNEEIAHFDCHVIAQYALLGRYDFLTVIDAPDNETVALLSIDLGSRGTVTIETLPAMSVDSPEAKWKAESTVASAG